MSATRIGPPAQTLGCTRLRERDPLNERLIFGFWILKGSFLWLTLYRSSLLSAWPNPCKVGSKSLFLLVCVCVLPSKPGPFGSGILTQLRPAILLPHMHPGLWLKIVFCFTTYYTYLCLEALGTLGSSRLRWIYCFRITESIYWPILALSMLGITRSLL